jgi:hypothetical protein
MRRRGRLARITKSSAGRHAFTFWDATDGRRVGGRDEAVAPRREHPGRRGDGSIESALADGGSVTRDLGRNATTGGMADALAAGVQVELAASDPRDG